MNMTEKVSYMEQDIKELKQERDRIEKKVESIMSK